jgi:DNA-binding transcriptional MerR regulator
MVTAHELSEADGQLGVGIAPASERYGGDQAAEPREARVVTMVVGGERVFSHAPRLTVEPNFKSSGYMTDFLLSIGEVGSRVGLATSAIRYYERRGLVHADARVSGQRRYRPETVRRLVFIGMLQDAGLDLDEIDGVLHAVAVEEWKAIARRRLTALDAEIERLQRARDYLEGALLCRYDHPATECRIMGAEIDRRLPPT